MEGIMNPCKRASLCSYVFKIVLYMPVLLFCLATLVGCVTPKPPITVKDSLPTNSHKGYVEFYYLKSEGTLGSPVDIYRIDNNTAPRRLQKWAQEGYIGNATGPKVGLRIAKLPGTYNFGIFLGDAENFVAVRVEEGKVTPVKIQFKNIHQDHRYPSRIRFDMIVTVESPRPIATSRL
jgi:hypothetical protein